ncbi:hypothetical protein [Tautonia plasticadhaerens]|uniref:Uncharacterized protein n=1 Tax=Tautonia plasticadhaerens TaxID=2527974 RepID=A0A518H2I6_9BACT|nr:hypothetical protein [Tautonia plasticadhaerens]QDV35061.1 hypothetical protein ElP_29630 [Tautonia plasticadhaerens]
METETDTVRMRGRPGVGASLLPLLLWAASGPGCSGPSPDPGAGTAGQGGALPPLPPASAGLIRPTRSAGELRAEAESLADRGDLPGAISALEDALMVDARDRDVLRLIVDYARRQSRAVRDDDPAQAYRLMVSAGEYLRTLRQHYPEPTDEERALALDVLYDEAAAHARSTRMEEATGALRELVAAGFRDFDRIRGDPDWDPLRAVPQFPPLFDEITAPHAAPE